MSESGSKRRNTADHFGCRPRGTLLRHKSPHAHRPSRYPRHSSGFSTVGVVLLDRTRNTKIRCGFRAQRNFADVERPSAKMRRARARATLNWEVSALVARRKRAKCRPAKTPMLPCPMTGSSSATFALFLGQAYSETPRYIRQLSSFPSDQSWCPRQVKIIDSLVHGWQAGTLVRTCGVHVLLAHYHALAASDIASRFPPLNGSLQPLSNGVRASI